MVVRSYRRISCGSRITELTRHHVI